MSASLRPSLANLLENFFDLEGNPQVKAVAAVLLLAFGFWRFSSDKLPTKAEGFAKARQAAGYGVVVRTEQSPRGSFGLDVMGSDNRLIQEAFWDSYYPLAVAADTANRLSYEDWHRLSLAAYAQVGDSLLKKPGSLSVQVKRGATSRTFYYRNPYQ
jgi:hypothetical protein